MYRLSLLWHVKMYHLQLGFSVLVCVFLSVCTQVRDTEAEEHVAHSVTTLKNACKKDGQLLQITEAFFCQQPDPSPCDDNCKPVNESQPSGLCFVPDNSHRHRGCNSGAGCRLRFSLDELNDVYEAVDTEHSSGNVDDLFAGRGKYVFRYVCGDGKQQKQINPCRGHADNSLGENYTSLLIRYYPSDHKECRTVCDLEPRGYFNLNINFLLADTATILNKHATFMYTLKSSLNKNNEGRNDKHGTYRDDDDDEDDNDTDNDDDNNSDDNNNNNNDDDDKAAVTTTTAATAATATADDGPDEDEWTTVHSGYFYESDNFLSDSIIKIRLHFNDLSTIRRFWIYFGGNQFSLKCTPEEKTATQQGSTMETSVSTRSYGTAKPEEPEQPTTGQAGKEGGISAYTYVVPVVVIALVIGIVIAGVFFVKRRQQQLRGKQSLAGDCRGTAPDNTPEDTQPESTYQQVNNEMQTANPAVESPYSVASTDDEYGRLALSGRPDRQREVNDLYDHTTTLPKPEGDDVYNVVNRDQKKQVVLDNIYDRTVKE